MDEILQSKDTEWLNGLKKKNLYTAYKDSLQIEGQPQTESEGMEKRYSVKMGKKKLGGYTYMRQNRLSTKDSNNKFSHEA